MASPSEKMTRDTNIHWQCVRWDLLSEWQFAEHKACGPRGSIFVGWGDDGVIVRAWNMRGAVDCTLEFEISKGLYIFFWGNSVKSELKLIFRL